MKVILTHEYRGFCVFHIWATENDAFNWPNSADDGIGLGRATYYKGRLKVIKAFNSMLVGQVWQGHYDWFDRQACPEYWNKLNEWQTCVPFEGDIEWWCLHSKDDAPIRVRYLPLTSEAVVSPGTSALVLEGTLVVNDAGQHLTAREMNHVLPRRHEITLHGDAKVWLISPE